MKVNPVGKTLSKTDWAYLAGLFDGDGAIMALVERHNEKRFGFRVRLNIKLTFSRRRDVEDIRQLLKVGYTRRNKRSYDWETRNQQVARVIIRSLLPYLRSKKRQAEIALQIARVNVKSKADLRRIARLADRLASYNLRSAGRRKNYASMI